jgi:hypothetical protein
MFSNQHNLQNSSLVYSLQSVLAFDALQYKMLATSSSKGRQNIRSHVTSTEAQWINLVRILGLKFFET